MFWIFGFPIKIQCSYKKYKFAILIKKIKINSIAYCLALNPNVRLSWAKKNYLWEENKLYMYCGVYDNSLRSECVCVCVCKYRIVYTIVSVYTYNLMWVVLFDFGLFDSFYMETVTSVNRNRSIDEYTVSVELWMLKASLGRSL